MRGTAENSDIFGGIYRCLTNQRQAPQAKLQGCSRSFSQIVAAAVVTIGLMQFRSFSRKREIQTGAPALRQIYWVPLSRGRVGAAGRRLDWTLP
jgi:hypothetical protein